MNTSAVSASEDSVLDMNDNSDDFNLVSLNSDKLDISSIQIIVLEDGSEDSALLDPEYLKVVRTEVCWRRFKLLMKS